MYFQLNRRGRVWLLTCTVTVNELPLGCNLVRKLSVQSNIHVSKQIFIAQYRHSWDQLLNPQGVPGYEWLCDVHQPMYDSVKQFRKALDSNHAS